MISRVETSNVSLFSAYIKKNLMTKRILWPDRVQVPVISVALPPSLVRKRQRRQYQSRAGPRQTGYIKAELNAKARNVITHRHTLAPRPPALPGQRRRGGERKQGGSTLTGRRWRWKEETGGGKGKRGGGERDVERGKKEMERGMWVCQGEEEGKEW